MGRGVPVFYLSSLSSSDFISSEHVWGSPGRDGAVRRKAALGGMGCQGAGRLWLTELGRKRALGAARATGAGGGEGLCKDGERRRARASPRALLCSPGRAQRPSAGWIQVEERSMVFRLRGHRIKVRVSCNLGGADKLAWLSAGIPGGPSPRTTANNGLTASPAGIGPAESLGQGMREPL